MQLTYRGNPYEVPFSNLPTRSNEVIGKYRGIKLAKPESEVAVAKPALNLKYRGSDYQPILAHLSRKTAPVRANAF